MKSLSRICTAVFFLALFHSWFLAGAVFSIPVYGKTQHKMLIDNNKNPLESIPITFYEEVAKRLKKWTPTRKMMSHVYKPRIKTAMKKENKGILPFYYDLKGMNAMVLMMLIVSTTISAWLWKKEKTPEEFDQIDM